MAKKSKNKRASISDRLVYALYRILETFLRLLPMEVVCVIGAALGQIGYYLMSRRRQIVIRNLRIAYSETLTPQELRALARKTFRYSGLNFMASITASTLSNEELIDRVEVVGRENLVKAYAEDHGCILLLAHMGNWELLTQLMILAPEIKTLGSLYRPLNNPLLDKLIKRRRQSRGASLYSRKDGFSKPITHLKQKGTLGVIADQSAGKHGVPVAFFGKLSSMTNLPALLYRKTKAPIIPVSMCTVSPGKWKAIFHPPVHLTENSKKDTYQITTQCATAYEQLMSESPADVLWMHNYWRGGKRTALKVRGITPRSKNFPGLSFSKKFHILIHPGDTITDAQLDETLTYLRRCRPDLHITLIGNHSAFPHTDHCLVIDTQEPPHLASNALRNLENSMPAPFDCSLDLSENGSGKSLLKQAGIAYIFPLSPPPTPIDSKNTEPMSYQDKLEHFIMRISPSSENTPTS